MYAWISAQSLAKNCSRANGILTNIDILQACQVQCGPNDIGHILREDNVASIVALVDRSQDVFGVICHHIIVTLHIAVAVSRWRSRKWLERLVWPEVYRRTGSLMPRDLLR